MHDHASIPATIEASFGLSALTARDANANSIDALLTLATPRTDAPARLPSPVAAAMEGVTSAMAMGEHADLTTLNLPDPNNTVDRGNLPVILHSALRQDIEMSPENRAQILQRVSNIKTREQARQDLAEVQHKVRKRRSSSALGKA